MNLKKIFLFVLLGILILSPSFNPAKAINICPTNIVPQTCGQGSVIADAASCPLGASKPKECPCDILDFFTVLNNIYNFIVGCVATPLAIIALTIGGILMLISTGNPNLMGLGKKIFYSAVIGLALVLCSWVIINTILTTLGYTGAWNSI